MAGSWFESSGWVAGASIFIARDAACRLYRSDDETQRHNAEPQGHSTQAQHHHAQTSGRSRPETQADMSRALPHVRRWYCSARWENMRKRQLARRPMCQCPHCKGAGLIANVVDHITPHKGDSRLFWNDKNLQSMNKQCHDRYKQSLERGGRGFDVGCDESGVPLNDDHPWRESEQQD